MSKPFSHLTIKTKFVLLGIILLAAFFRFYNTNWDYGLLFHPDERNIANAVSHISLISQMDPQFYAYGGFLIYLYKITADILSFVLTNPQISHDWGWINIIGRSYSAFFSVLTIFPIFLLGEKLFSRKAGILASMIYAVTVSSIQTAHYATTESLLTLLISVITYTCLLWYENPTVKRGIGIGILLGVAVATKTTGLSFFLVPGITLLLLFFTKKLPLLHIGTRAFLLGLMALITFSIFSPFTFLNSEKFFESMRYENGVVRGTLPVVYTLQFTHTIPYLYQIVTLLWQMGIFAIVVIGGVVTTSYREIKKKRTPFLIFIAFPLMYFLYIGSWHTKFNRYMVLLFPFFIILGSTLLIWLMHKYKLLGKIITGFIVLATFLYAVAFLSLYTREQTRVEASRWIYKNVPQQSFILSEHWDEGLPVPLPEGSPVSYRLLPLTIYNEDNEAKLEYYATYLSQADYVTINSRRLYGTLMHLPEKYPLTKRYYELLFAEKLGYTKVAEFSSYPSLFGMTINDDSSEETFQVYDHPKSFIFQNTRHYSFQEIKRILTDK